MKKNLLTFFVMVTALAPARQNFERNFSSIHLKTIEQVSFSMDEIKKNNASVFVFLLADCPGCQSYSLTLNQFSKTYRPSGIRFYGVFPGHYNTTAEMKEFQTRFKINFQLITDPEKVLVKNLGATITPEVFVVDNNGKTRYHGRIDDWMYAAGKKKLTVTTHELEDALNAVAHHQTIKISETKAIGCIIE